MRSKTEIIDDFILEYCESKRKTRRLRFYGKTGTAIKQDLVKFLYIQRLETVGGENRKLERQSFRRITKVVYGVGVLTASGRYYCWKSRVGCRGTIRRDNLEVFRKQFLTRFYYDSTSRICMVNCNRDFVDRMFHFLSTIVACDYAARTEKAVFSRLKNFCPPELRRRNRGIKFIRNQIFKRLCEVGVLDFAGENLYTLVQNMTLSDGLAMSRCATGIFYMWYSKYMSDATRKTPGYKWGGAERRTGQIIEEENA